MGPLAGVMLLVIVELSFELLLSVSSRPVIVAVLVTVSEPAWPLAVTSTVKLTLALLLAAMVAKVHSTALVPAL